MGRVAVHCSGCSKTVSVDGRFVEHGLRIARWCRSQGEPFCPDCAQSRGLRDPWASPDDQASHNAWSDDAQSGLARGPISHEVVPQGPASDDEQTRVACARYARRGWAWLAASGALCAATLGFTAYESHRASELLRTGIRTVGLVQYSTSGPEIAVKYNGDGSILEGDIQVPSGGEHEAGEEIWVIYSRSDPTRIRTPQYANESPIDRRIKLYGFTFAALLLLAGLQVLRRPRRWRRFMRTPWTPYASTYVPARPRRSGPGLMIGPLGEDQPEPTPLRLSATMKHRAARLASETVVWVAGDPSSSVVVAIPRTRELFAAAPPRGWTGRRWLEAQTPMTRRDKRAIRAYLILLGLCSGALALAAARQGAWPAAAPAILSAAALARVASRTRQK